MHQIRLKNPLKSDYHTLILAAKLISSEEGGCLIKTDLKDLYPEYKQCHYIPADKYGLLDIVYYDKEEKLAVVKKAQFVTDNTHYAIGMDFGAEDPKTTMIVMKARQMGKTMMYPVLKVSKVLATDDTMMLVKTVNKSNWEIGTSLILEDTISHQRFNHGILVSYDKEIDVAHIRIK